MTKEARFSDVLQVTGREKISAATGEGSTCPLMVMSLHRKKARNHKILSCGK